MKVVSTFQIENRAIVVFVTPLLNFANCGHRMLGKSTNLIYNLKDSETIFVC